MDMVLPCQPATCFQRRATPPIKLAAILVTLVARLGEIKVWLQWSFLFVLQHFTSGLITLNLNCMTGRQDRSELRDIGDGGSHSAAGLYGGVDGTWQYTLSQSQVGRLTSD